jgi:hypothetical protein
MSLVEALVEYARAQGSPRVVVAGTSLGGWVTNLHRAYFNSADAYRPLLAGTAMEDVFLAGAYREKASDVALCNPNVLVEALNLERAFMAVPDGNVYPLLARYDQVVRYDRQRASYGDHPVAVIERGHMTGIASSHLLRAHILGALA